MESMYTVINVVFQLFLSYQVFEIQCVLYTYSSSQLRLATFQVLDSHVWLYWEAQEDHAPIITGRQCCSSI